MPRRPFPMSPRDRLEANGQASVIPNEPSRDPHGGDLATWHPFSDVRSRRCASVGTPIWRVIRLYTVGAVIPSHDVSGTGWQILGRATQSITTMMPEWQRGHARNDCP